MESFTNFEKAPDLTKRGYRLDRMELLLHFFDDPHLCGKVIHIAGSKGKGSTASFAASILKEAGYRTGLYSSPHISDYRERITIDGEFAREEIYLSSMNRIRELIEDDRYLNLPGGSEPTTFELLTLLAFLVFKEMKCDWTVLETGLGGRLDATNLVKPELVLLTPIELEHTDLLGETLEQIASEKAGIIKKNCHVISSEQKDIPLQVFREKASTENVPFFYLPDMIDTKQFETELKGNHIHILWKDGRSNNSVLLLPGDHQGENCSLAIAGIKEVLPEIDDALIDKGAAKAFLPGRMEKISDNPPVIADGAHTKQSMEKTLKTFLRLYPQKSILVFGSVEGKDAVSMVSILSGHFEHIIVSRPGTFKKSRPGYLFDLFCKADRQVYLIEEPQKALEKALDLSKGELPVLVTGSFYMAAEIRNILKKRNNT